MRNYLDLLPINGRTIETQTGETWTVEVKELPFPSPDKADLLRYGLHLRRSSDFSECRLNLWVCEQDLAVHRRQEEAVEEIRRWLEGDRKMTDLKLWH